VGLGTLSLFSDGLSLPEPLLNPVSPWSKRLKTEGCLVVSIPLKILISWDDYSQYMGKKNMFQTTNQKV
jgi:hypothetical protein